MSNHDAPAKSGEPTAKGRILVIDDHVLFRDIVSAYLASQGYEVSGTGEIHAAVSLLQCDQKFDLILLDYSMPGSLQYNNFLALRSVDPSAVIAILTASISPVTLMGARSIGANGFISKSKAPGLFLAAVDLIISGSPYFESPADQKQLDKTQLPCMTAREFEILKMLCEGHSNKKLSDMLGISESTIKAHLKSIYTKMGARNRSHAYSIAKKNYIV